jgi:hypothetical protein
MQSLVPGLYGVQMLDSMQVCSLNNVVAARDRKQAYCTAGHWWSVLSRHAVTTYSELLLSAL